MAMAVFGVGQRGRWCEGVRGVDFAILLNLISCKLDPLVGAVESTAAF